MVENRKFLVPHLLIRDAIFPKLLYPSIGSGLRTAHPVSVRVRVRVRVRVIIVLVLVLPKLINS